MCLFFFFIDYILIASFFLLSHCSLFLFEALTRRKRSNTYATSPAAERSTARRPTCGPTSAGTQGSGLSSAPGPSAANGSRDPTSSSATNGPTQVKKDRGLDLFVVALSCVVTFQTVAEKSNSCESKGSTMPVVVAAHTYNEITCNSSMKGQVTSERSHR